MREVDNDHCVAARQPLVRYRGKDEQRCRQLDSLHDEVADKVDEVIESFKAVSSRTEIDEGKRQSQWRLTRKHRVDVGQKLPARWLFAALCSLGLGLLALGWIQLH